LLLTPSFTTTLATSYLTVGNLRLMSVTHSVNGVAIGTASMVTAVLTLIGIGLLVGVYTFAPVRRSRHIITHRS